MTLEDLRQPHRSRPWNPLIAQPFYRREIIETWGRGTLKMAELMEQTGLFAPEFEVSAGEVLVRFRPMRRFAQPSREPELTLLQQELLQMLSVVGSASLAQIRTALQTLLPERTVQRHLGQLREIGLVEQTGRAIVAEKCHGITPYLALFGCDSNDPKMFSLNYMCKQKKMTVKT